MLNVFPLFLLNCGHSITHHLMQVHQVEQVSQVPQVHQVQLVHQVQQVRMARVTTHASHEPIQLSVLYLIPIWSRR